MVKTRSKKELQRKTDPKGSAYFIDRKPSADAALSHLLVEVGVTPLFIENIFISMGFHREGSGGSPKEGRTVHV